VTSKNADPLPHRKKIAIPSRDGPLTADVNWDEKRKEMRLSLSLKRTPNSKQRTATWILTPREGMEFNDALEELLEFLEYLSQTGGVRVKARNRAKGGIMYVRELRI